MDEEGEPLADHRLNLVPLPPYMWTAVTLEEVARLIRHLHDATADFPL